MQIKEVNIKFNNLLDKKIIDILYQKLEITFIVASGSYTISLQDKAYKKASIQFLNNNYYTILVGQDILCIDQIIDQQYNGTTKTQTTFAIYKLTTVKGSTEIKINFISNKKI